MAPSQKGMAQKTTCRQKLRRQWHHRFILHSKNPLPLPHTLAPIYADHEQVANV
jgi:hypothetical protein